MKIAALYARVSGERQRDDNTIASQTEALIAYAEDHGYSGPEGKRFAFHTRSMGTARPGASPMRCVAGSRAGSTATWDLPSRPSATCASMPRSSSSNRSGSLQ